MSLEIFLVALRYAGIALSGIFGMLALLTKYKDDGGNITRWGRIALVGVIVSTLISIVSQTVDLAIKANDAKLSQQKTAEQLESSRKILESVNKTLNPLTNVRASYWLEVDLRKDELQGFVSRFNADLGSILGDLESGRKIPDALDIKSMLNTPDGKLLTLIVGSKSTLFPNSTQERFAHTVLRHENIKVYFYKQPITIDDLPDYGNPNPTAKVPDMVMSFDGNNDDNPDISLQFDLFNKNFVVVGSYVKSDEGLWDSSGEIVSFLDLPNCQIFIKSGHNLVSLEEESKRVHPDLSDLILQIGTRKGIRFRRDRMKKHVNPVGGDIVYEFVLPKTLEEFSTQLN